LQSERGLQRGSRRLSTAPKIPHRLTKDPKHITKGENQTPQREVLFFFPPGDLVRGLNKKTKEEADSSKKKKPAWSQRKDSNARAHRVAVHPTKKLTLPNKKEWTGKKRLTPFADVGRVGESEKKKP